MFTLSKYTLMLLALTVSVCYSSSQMLFVFHSPQLYVLGCIISKSLKHAIHDYKMLLTFRTDKTSWGGIQCHLLHFSWSLLSSQAKAFQINLPCLANTKDKKRTTSWLVWIFLDVNAIFYCKLTFLGNRTSCYIHHNNVIQRTSRL